MSLADTLKRGVQDFVQSFGVALRKAFAEADVLDAKVNATNASDTNATGAAGEFSGKKPPSSLEGLITAYTGLVIMALIPIYFGSFKSVKFQEHNKTLPKDQQAERMSTKDAMMFPVIASCALFGLYLLFYFFGKEYINLLLTFYFFALGVISLASLLRPVTNLVPLIPKTQQFRIVFDSVRDEKTEDYFRLEFNHRDILAFLVSAGIGVWYLTKKHWIANNLFGLGFSLSAIELLTLNTVTTGCILLGGLFFYDIFWVFGSNVMVFVAKSFDAPIKLVFPQDLLEQGLAAKNFAMLGLGDIVIPGIFIALMLRFDNFLRKSHNRKGNFYFNTTFLAYFVGLVLTIVVMHVFKHAQPALLYLVPTCLGFPILSAIVRGDLKRMFSYEDHPKEDETDIKKTK